MRGSGLAECLHLPSAGCRWCASLRCLHGFEERGAQAARGQVVGLIQTMRDIDETPVKDDEAEAARQAFTAALAQLSSRPPVPEQERKGEEEAAGGMRAVAGAPAELGEGVDEAAGGLSRWPHNTFRIWTARKAQPRSRWRSWLL